MHLHHLTYTGQRLERSTGLLEAFSGWSHIKIIIAFPITISCTGGLRDSAEIDQR